MPTNIEPSRRRRSKRPKGSIDVLPSGALRVRVYGGIDPVTGKRYYLTEIVEPGPQAEREAEKIRRHLVNQVDEHQQPRTNATVNQLLDKHLEMLHVEESTRRTYRRYVWTVMTTSPRRAEVCGLRWKHFEPERQRLTLRRNIVQDGAELWEKDTKNHQRRHIALDSETVAVLSDYKAHCEQRAAQLRLRITPESFIFSLSPDGSEPLKPQTASQRYNRLAERLGIATTLHKLRHYSATELIAAGVDIRTVAGRLGHSGGGTTTLKVYAAWVNEADQRASATLLSRVPVRPAPPLDPAERAKTDPQSPYEKIAAQLRLEILDGVFKPGDCAPTVKDLQAMHGVGAGTAHRALGLLKTWGMVEASRGRRAAILEPDECPEPNPEPSPSPDLRAAADPTNSPVALDLRLLLLGAEARQFTARADPTDPDQLHRLLAGAARRHGGKDADVADYELEVRRTGEKELITTFAAF